MNEILHSRMIAHFRHVVICMLAVGYTRKEIHIDLLHLYAFRHISIQYLIFFPLP